MGPLKDALPTELHGYGIKHTMQLKEGFCHILVFCPLHSAIFALMAIGVKVLKFSMLIKPVLPKAA